jgi:hypothetical protein
MRGLAQADTISAPETVDTFGAVSHPPARRHRLRHLTAGTVVTAVSVVFAAAGTVEGAVVLANARCSQPCLRLLVLRRRRRRRRLLLLLLLRSLADFFPCPAPDTPGLGHRNVLELPEGLGGARVAIANHVSYPPTTLGVASGAPRSSGSVPVLDQQPSGRLHPCLQPPKHAWNALPARPELWAQLDPRIRSTP